MRVYRKEQEKGVRIWKDVNTSIFDIQDEKVNYSTQYIQRCKDISVILVKFLIP